MARRRTPPPAPRSSRTPDGLTAKQARFCEEYLVDLNATQAATRAGYSAKTANEQGARLLAIASVAGRVAELMAARSERTQITADEVLKRFWAMATADPNELIEFRRTCCRFCYGRSHQYQRTRAEMDRARQEWEAAQAKAGGEVKSFDARGGTGYDARKAPHHDCPECFGEGIGQAFPRDTRTLSPEARILYAGVKVTKDGLEVKMHDQQDALVTVGRHLKMFTEKHEHSGKDGGPLESVVKVIAYIPDNGRGTR